jgi:hypothetical protein
MLANKTPQISTEMEILNSWQVCQIYNSVLGYATEI